MPLAHRFTCPSVQGAHVPQGSRGKGGHPVSRLQIASAAGVDNRTAEFMPHDEPRVPAHIKAGLPVMQILSADAAGLNHDDDVLPVGSRFFHLDKFEMSGACQFHRDHWFLPSRRIFYDRIIESAFLSCTEGPLWGQSLSPGTAVRHW